MIGSFLFHTFIKAKFYDWLRSQGGWVSGRRQWVCFLVEVDLNVGEWEEMVGMVLVGVDLMQVSGRRKWVWFLFG